MHYFFIELKKILGRCHTNLSTSLIQKFCVRHWLASQHALQVDVVSCSKVRALFGQQNLKYLYRRQIILIWLHAVNVDH